MLKKYVYSGFKLKLVGIRIWQSQFHFLCIIADA